MCGFIKGVSGGCFELINKWCYPQTTFTHNQGPTDKIGITPFLNTSRTDNVSLLSTSRIGIFADESPTLLRHQ